MLTSQGFVCDPTYYKRQLPTSSELKNALSDTAPSPSIPEPGPGTAEYDAAHGIYQGPEPSAFGPEEPSLSSGDQYLQDHNLVDHTLGASEPDDVTPDYYDSGSSSGGGGGSGGGPSS